VAAGAVALVNKSRTPSFFEGIGGLSTLERVHKRFYDKVYVHPWLGRFFEGHDQQAIELRQTQFMAEKFGADLRYPGMVLELAHRRMYIPGTLLKERQKLLREALEEEGLSASQIRRWLNVDHAFCHHVRNESRKEFEAIDLKYERPLIVPEPEE